ncbi:MAG: hypothetical protein F4X76_08505, partial [Chloroflexi bacterium]|nr:hypothetical protein [Chloroflexota bacterium]
AASAPGAAKARRATPRGGLRSGGVPAAALDSAGLGGGGAAGRAPGFEWGEIPGHGEFTSSVWQGVQRGNRSVETDYVNGEIVLIGALHGVPTPWNRALQQAANHCVRNGIEPGSIGVAEFVADVERDIAAGAVTGGVAG